MAYPKHNFQDGQILTAAMMNEVEDGIAGVEENAVGIYPQTLTDVQKDQARKNLSVPAETAELLPKPTRSGYLDTSGGTVDISAPVESSGYYHEVEDCNAGDQFTVKGEIARTGAGYLVIIAGDGTKLHSESTHTTRFSIVTAPEGAAKVIRQYRTSGNPAKNIWYKGATVAARLEALEARVAALENA